MIDPANKGFSWGKGCLIACFALAGCGSREIPPYRVKMDSAYPPAVVNMAVTVDGTDRDGRLIEAVGLAAKGVGMEMITGHPPVPQPFQRITFTARAPEIEQKDSLVGSKIIHLSYDAQALRDLVKGDADADAILGAAEESGWWTPYNDDVVDDYCRTHAGGTFCAKAHAE